jgi:hypothetical protein
MKNFQIALSLFSLFFLLFSCSNNNQNKEVANDIDDVVVEETARILEKYPMPTSYDMIQFLNNTGASFVFDITNPADNVENYLSYKQKAINLGIYAADLIYTATYQKKDETAVYLDNFVQLVEDLEISNLDRQFFRSVQSNLDNKDSLLIIIKNAQMDTHKYLEENNKNEVALYALVGSWVEGMYLMGATLKFSENKQAIYDKIIENKNSLEDLLIIMKPFKEADDFKDLYDRLSDINSKFNSLKGNKGDEEKLAELKDLIMEFRNSLI